MFVSLVLMGESLVEFDPESKMIPVPDLAYPTLGQALGRDAVKSRVDFHEIKILSQEPQWRKTRRLWLRINHPLPIGVTPSRSSKKEICLSGNHACLSGMVGDGKQRCD